jgi:hypothetical protein
MKNRELVRYSQRLNSLFDKAKQLTDDLELQAHWARYLCVLVCGFLETAVRTIYGEYARTRADTNISNYVAKSLNRFRSPSMGNIVKMTTLFNKEWGDCLEQNTRGQLKDAVDSIVNLRHQIAHGRDTGVSYVQIHEYYQSAVRVVELLEEQCQ